MVTGIWICEECEGKGKKHLRKPCILIVAGGIGGPDWCPNADENYPEKANWKPCAPSVEGREDSGKKGQARADKEGDELPES